MNPEHQYTDSERIEAIEGILGHLFVKKDLLLRALTHSSYAKEQGDIDEECSEQDALATLGDAILKAVLTEHLYRLGPEEKGNITENRIELEKNEYLAKVTEEFEIGRFLKAGRGALLKDRVDQSTDVLARTFEALIGAVYLDSEFGESREVIKRLLGISDLS